jgi:hypothetical protein
MEPRLIIAYSLIFLMVLAAGIFAYRAIRERRSHRDTSISGRNRRR